MVGHCLTSVTNFRVADALGDTPQTAAELAGFREVLRRRVAEPCLGGLSRLPLKVVPLAAD
jgi:hypothetical protein